MFRKISAILASCALVLSLTACGGGNDSGASTSGTGSEADTSQQEDSSAPESESSAFVPEDDGVYYDLEAVYDAIIEAQPEDAKLPPMKRVTDMEVIKELYDGIENVEAMQVVDGFLANVYKPCLINQDIIELKHDIFNPDAIVMRGLTSNYVDLLSKKNDSCIRFYFSDFEILDKLRGFCTSKLIVAGFAKVHAIPALIFVGTAKSSPSFSKAF